LPRTLISDLPGGFGNCYEAPQRRRLEHPSKQRSLAGSPACRRGPRLSRLGAPGRCAALHDSMQTLPSLFGLAPCGVYPAPGVTAGAVRSYRTISPLPRRWRFRNGERTRQAGQLGYCVSRVALARHEDGGGVAGAVSFLWHWPSMSLHAHVPDVIRHTALRSSDFPPPADFA
jgi:hypothetical protein